MTSPAFSPSTGSGGFGSQRGRAAATLCLMAPLAFSHTTTSMMMQTLVIEGTTSSGSQGRSFGSGTTRNTALLSTRKCIQEIRSISGLTWKEIAAIFGVSPRSIHLWMAGEQVRAEHEVHLREVLAKIRILHDGDMQATASKLRSMFGDGPLFSALLTAPISVLERWSVSSAPPAAPVDQATLMANWRPVAPFHDRWEDEPAMDVVTVGSYPAKRIKVASKRRG